MNLGKKIKDNMSQILAITEKNVKLSIRFKIPLLFSFFSPFLNIILPLVIMGQLFSFNATFGPWNPDNFVVFQLMAYQISILWQITNKFSSDMKMEKFWQTLQALIIAPFNRINLMFGIILSHLIVVLIPIAIFFIMCFIFYPVSITTVLFVITLFLLITLIFSSVGLILAIFTISREGFVSIISMGLTILFIFTCISLPFDFFPEYFQFFVTFNPLYYIFDFPRLVWIEDDILLSILLHPNHFMIILSLALISPFIAVLIFNFVYKKYGISGF